MAQIPAEAVFLLEGKHVANIATVNADGSPQVTPVWIGHDGDTVTFNTVKGRLKDRNLRRDPRVSISIVDAEDPYRPLLINGRVTEMTGEGAEADIDDLAERYLGLDEYPNRRPGEERIRVLISPEKASY